MAAQILSAIITIIVGVGGAIAYFWGANRLLDLVFPSRGVKGTAAIDNLRRQSMIRPWLFIGPALVILTVFAAPLLIAAGIALLRHSPRAALLSQIVAVFWLALAAVAQIAFPWMSIFSRLLAFVFPIALLLFVWRREVRRMA